MGDDLSLSTLILPPVIHLLMFSPMMVAWDFLSATCARCVHGTCCTWLDCRFLPILNFTSVIIHLALHSYFLGLLSNNWVLLYLLPFTGFHRSAFSSNESLSNTFLDHDRLPLPFLPFSVSTIVQVLASSCLY